MRQILIFISIASLLFTASGCTKINYVEEDQFIGVWKLSGRPYFEGIRIEITNESGQLKGQIVQLNDQKLINMFAENGDLWVSSIERSSNYEFNLVEMKLAAQLFSMYDIPATAFFKARFIHSDTIGLAKGSKDPLKSNIRYIRVQ
jgi:hypothetical protein